MTVQNKTITWVPQGANPETEKLKLSVAVELLFNHCCAMEMIMMAEPDAYDDEDLINFIRSVEYLTTYGGRRMNEPTHAENLLDSRDPFWRSSYNIPYRRSIIS